MRRNKGHSWVAFIIRALLWLRGKESSCNAGNASLIPGSGRSPGKGNGNSLQYSSPGNPIDRGAWWATIHGTQKSGARLATRQQLLV